MYRILRSLTMLSCIYSINWPKGHLYIITKLDVLWDEQCPIDGRPINHVLLHIHCKFITPLWMWHKSYTVMVASFMRAVEAYRFPVDSWSSGLANFLNEWKLWPFENLNATFIIEDNRIHKIFSIILIVSQW